MGWQWKLFHPPLYDFPAIKHSLDKFNEEVFIVAEQTSSNDCNWKKECSEVAVLADFMVAGLWYDSEVAIDDHTTVMAIMLDVDLHSYQGKLPLSKIHL